MTVLTTSFPLGKGAVSGVFVQRLLDNLPPDVQATVVTPGGSERFSSDDESCDYRVRTFRYAPRSWQKLAHQPGGIPVALSRNMGMRFILIPFLISMFVACFREARKSDLIHANWSVNGAVAGIVGLLTRKPVMTTLRGEDVVRAESSWLYRRFLLLCLKTNYRVVTVSEAICGSVKKQYPNYLQKVSFLPNGVAPELLKVESAARGAKDVFRLVTVGSLIPRKGVDVIIDALTQLQGPIRFHLSVIGSGAELARLESLVQRQSLHESVEFVGEVAPEEVVGQLVKADALILASYSEGRPNVVLEALAAGVPVVVSDIDGLRELITDGENGSRFPAGDAKALAAKIEHLAENDELQAQFASRGREFIIRNHLIWDDVGEQYARIYREAVSR